MDDDESILTIDNQSDFFLDEIYLAEAGEDYGGNLAPSDGLFPDEFLEIEADCGFYDLLVVDNEGVECEVLDIDLCLNDAVFIFRNNTCSVFEAAAKAKAEAAKKDAGVKADDAATSAKNAPGTQI